jgi:SynChlorMet cassette radical SAM/SPASM protein ScmF
MAQRRREIAMTSPTETASTATKAPKLRSLYLYLTDECDQRCAHCWVSPSKVGGSTTRPPSLDRYQQLIDAAIPLGLRSVKVTGGEPLLSENAFPIIEHVTKRERQSIIETNAMQVGAAEADFLKRHRATVNVSLDGATAAVHDRRRGLAGAFARTLRALELLADRAIDLTVVTAVSRSNRDEIPGILELLRGLKREGSMCLKLNPVTLGGRAHSLARTGELFCAEELRDLATQFSEDLQPRYRKHGIDLILQLELPFFSIDALTRGCGQIGAHHCGFLTLLSTLADGSITFCGIGYETPSLVMGNIKEDYDLADIWYNHKKLKEMRSCLPGSLEGVCSVCLFRFNCLGGCRASAVAATGSMTASPASCQALYDAGLFPASRLQSSLPVVQAAAGS